VETPITGRRIFIADHSCRSDDGLARPFGEFRREFSRRDRYSA
jgi:hypothetical protein